MEIRAIYCVHRDPSEITTITGASIEPCAECQRELERGADRAPCGILDCNRTRVQWVASEVIPGMMMTFPVCGLHAAEIVLYETS